jgi:mono/diheme cytochrome c family protein
MIKGLILGVILGVLILVAAGYLYFAWGQAPVATASPSMPFERTFAKLGLHKYLDKLPHPNPAVPADEPNFLQGAKIYKEHCAVCHGLPDQPKTFIALGMFPKPPQLFQGMGVTDDEPWETYWKVSGGIRLTGMPGFVGHLTETQMWQVTVLIKNMDKISPAVKAELLAPMTIKPLPPGAVPKDQLENDHDHTH